MVIGRSNNAAQEWLRWKIDWSTKGLPIHQGFRHCRNHHAALMQHFACAELRQTPTRDRFLSTPCRRIPGATIGTNKRISAAITHATVDVCDAAWRCHWVWWIALSSPQRWQTPAEQNEAVQLVESLQNSSTSTLICIWALSFRHQTETVPLALDRKAGMQLIDHSA